MTDDTATEALRLLREFQEAERLVDSLERQLAEARIRRDEKLGALRRHGTEWQTMAKPGGKR